VTGLARRLASTSGEFHGSWALGDFDGDKSAAQALQTFFDSQPNVAGRDSVLIALIDEFTDTARAKAQYSGQRISRGAVAYFMLRNLIYREGLIWPGNLEDYPTSVRLRRAQIAWREAVQKHWYVAS
jgi:hypothetical protein